MVLTVPFDGFAAAAKAHTDAKVVYVSALGSQTVVTAADLARGTIVRSHTSEPLEGVIDSLTRAGLEVKKGAWGERTEDLGALWVAAVAYKSAEDTPGLWVDTFQTKPSTGQVLAELYEEFRETGEIGDVSMEEFIRLADPNVVVLSPEQQAEFAHRAHGCE